METFKIKMSLDEIDEALQRYWRHPRSPGEMGDGPFYVESMIVIANRTTVLKADENPFYLKDGRSLHFPGMSFLDDSGARCLRRKDTTRKGSRH